MRGRILVASMLLALAGPAPAGCGALKADAFGNRAWASEGLALDDSGGERALRVMVMRVGLEETPLIEPTLILVFEDATSVELELELSLAPGACGWTNSQ